MPGLVEAPEKYISVKYISVKGQRSEFVFHDTLKKLYTLSV